MVLFDGSTLLIWPASWVFCMWVSSNKGSLSNPSHNAKSPGCFVPDEIILKTFPDSLSEY